jgi:hypothetical protein
MKKRHYFIQDGATARTVRYSVIILNEVFEDTLISRRLWPTMYPDFNNYDLGGGDLKRTVLK